MTLVPVLFLIAYCASSSVLLYELGSAIGLVLRVPDFTTEQRAASVILGCAVTGALMYIFQYMLWNISAAGAI
jgi:hypothetical protein